ncbi:MAG: octaprenyl diphosphate synthase [Gammaproteobacteria bacterium]|jgi:octaprenyl-diphosphate synthase
MDISEIRALVEDDMQAVNALILNRLESDVVLINQIGHYIINSGGKRLRPMLVLLAARALGYEGQRHIDLAAIIEFIHTATLLHDDVVDESDMRRSNETANAVWGNAASVLVGDFLYSRSFEMMVDVNLMPVMEILSHATNRIAEGEVLQLLNCNDPDVTEQSYREVILRKTAVLFEAGTRLGAIISESETAIEKAMAEFGLHLGIAFQMIDDALDYGSSDVDIGKNIGDDLAEGKPTLPIIRAMQQCQGEDRDLLRKIIEKGGTEDTELVLKVIQSTDAIDYTFKLAELEADKAIEALNTVPASSYKDSLIALANYAVKRDY